MSTARLLVVHNPWQQLQQFTAARIALGRTGVSLPTQPHLAFQLAHARARDAVHQALDVQRLVNDLEAAGLAGPGEALLLDSAATSRLEYLQRPDLGRQLNAASRERLQLLVQRPAARSCDVTFVIADGLSAQAVAQHAVPLLAAVLRHPAAESWARAPLVIARQARVAIGDEIAALLGASVVVLLIGERPGLSSPDSMGIYLTWNPHVGLRDDSRNCISNVRPAGLSHEEAAGKVHYLLSEMRKRQLSGVLLKEEAPPGDVVPMQTRKNFLLGRGE